MYGYMYICLYMYIYLYIRMYIYVNIYVYFVEVSGHYTSAYAAATAVCARTSASSGDSGIANGVYASVGDIISAVSAVNIRYKNMYIYIDRYT
jgi:hypothetical protein